MATQDVRAADARAAPSTDATFSYVHWGAIIAGALAAAALAFVLHSFAVAIGLAVSSTAPTWRDTSFALVALSGIYLALAAIISYVGATAALTAWTRQERVKARPSRVCVTKDAAISSREAGQAVSIATARHRLWW
jgi:membrane protein implicated in regulation of membrane protease activity